MDQSKAFFLDRDGTINIDHVYIANPDKIELIPGAALAIRKIKAAGFFVVVVSNQSGIGRGLIDPNVMPLIHQRLDELLVAEAAPPIDLYQICIHHPDDGCQCRKPKPLLVEQAATRLGIDLSKSFFVGDKLTDVQTGINAGCERSVLVRTGKGNKEEAGLKALADKNDSHTVISCQDNLLAAVDFCLKPLKTLHE